MDNINTYRFFSTQSLNTSIAFLVYISKQFAVHSYAQWAMFAGSPILLQCADIRTIWPLHIRGRCCCSADFHHLRLRPPVRFWTHTSAGGNWTAHYWKVNMLDQWRKLYWMCFYLWQVIWFSSDEWDLRFVVHRHRFVYSGHGVVLVKP